jgi:catechol 2,3-dioxygenase-like lactoylglutathione lyase family enzyme
MPLGDPMGGDYQDDGKGTPSGVWIVSIPVSNLDVATDFYSRVVGLDVILDEPDNNWVELGSEESLGNIALYEPSAQDGRQPGGQTGIVFRTGSIYDVHKRLVDADVVFKLKPERQEWGGLLCVFVDPDGNEIAIMEDPEHYTRATPSDRDMDRGRLCFMDRECI